MPSKEIDRENKIIDDYNAAVKLPGGWPIGGQCYFTRPETETMPRKRTQGIIIDYDSNTEMVTIKDPTGEYKQRFSKEYGGISECRGDTWVDLGPNCVEKWKEYHEIIDRRDKISYRSNRRLDKN